MQALKDIVKQIAHTITAFFSIICRKTATSLHPGHFRPPRPTTTKGWMQISSTLLLLLIIFTSADSFHIFSHASTADVIPLDHGGTVVTARVTNYSGDDGDDNTGMFPPRTSLDWPQDAGYPTMHNSPGGSGTYADPITVQINSKTAADGKLAPDGPYQIGERFYVPRLHLYFIAEDSCNVTVDYAGCTNNGVDTDDSTELHLNLYVGNVQDQAQYQAQQGCENSFGGSTQVIADAGEGYPLPSAYATGTALYDTSTQSCVGGTLWNQTYSDWTVGTSVAVGAVGSATPDMSSTAGTSVWVSGEATNTETSATGTVTTMNPASADLPAIPSFLIASSPQQVRVWATSKDGSQKLAPLSDLALASGTSTAPVMLQIGTTVRQTMIGFGASLTDSSAYLVSKDLDATKQQQVLTALFDRNNGIGIDFLRQPIGASDLALSEYDYDNTAGDTDMADFSIQHDMAYIIPVLQAALKVNPDITIIATPWSAPGWMKTGTNGDPLGLYGGQLNPDDMQAFANYLAAFIKAYQAQGVPISGITPQNEPTSSKFMPSMYLSSDAETSFIGQYLGPTLAHDNLTTNIIALDHNYDMVSYAESVSGNATTVPYVYGTAFHCYGGGDPSPMTDYHNWEQTQNPPLTQVIMETECSGWTPESYGASSDTDPAYWSGEMSNTLDHLFAAVNNWSSTFVRWGLIMDPDGSLNLAEFDHSAGDSCNKCSGLIAVDQTGNSFVATPDYYAIGQVSKFVLPGAQYIESTLHGGSSNSLETAVFKNTTANGGSYVLVAYNTDSSDASLDVATADGNHFSASIPAGAVETFVWGGSAAS